jgi:epoxyqueuosine reductase
MNRAEWIKSVIEEGVLGKENSLMNSACEPAWETPLIGFSRGDDPLWAFLKEDIGDFFWTPFDAFSLHHPGQPVSAGELTVISWVLPQTRATKMEQRRQRRYPSERWARARKFGEDFNVWLRDHVVRVLEEAGYAAVAPADSPHWKRAVSVRRSFASTWSERHAAYVSGLGTFGLCDGLITPKGKAVRFGSVVARIDIEPTPRPYADHHAYCLFYSHGTCGLCIKRCPANALSEQGHDKVPCEKYVRDTGGNYVSSHYGFEMYACGLCQVAVPCESGIPRPPRSDRQAAHSGAPAKQ